METPDRIYKYLPRRFADGFVKQGSLLFRNLAYFRQLEDKGRSDLLEGLHMDKPDNDVELSHVNGDVFYKGPLAFLRSINQERLFVFCLSEIHEPFLYDEFKADCCVEVIDVGDFLKRCEQALGKQPQFRGSRLFHSRVEYYAPNRQVRGDITDPRQIPFFKHEAYSHQKEFRLALALEGGLETSSRIVGPGFTLEPEALAAKPAEREVQVGSLEDIVRVHTTGSQAA